jgi:hypothetical protein
MYKKRKLESPRSVLGSKSRVKPLEPKPKRGRPNKIPRTTVLAERKTANLTNHPGRIVSPEFKFGDKIEARWKGKKHYYSGTVLDLGWNAGYSTWNYDIEYDEYEHGRHKYKKEIERGVASSLVRPATVFIVERILLSKTVKGKMVFKVRWRGCGAEMDSWEPQENLHPQLVQCYLLKED